MMARNTALQLPVPSAHYACVNQFAENSTRPGMPTRRPAELACTADYTPIME